MPILQRSDGNNPFGGLFQNRINVVPLKPPPYYMKTYIFSITETRTCEYEIQILTSALCKSPFYAQRLDTDTFGIPCEKVGTSPTSKFLLISMTRVL